jgi:4-alpha-glucanotransferase
MVVNRSANPNGNRILPTVPPFPPEYRASGVLLHVTSLPSRYGIGDVGPAAMKWIDLLQESGQSWWQSLPLGPTGYGNSPYQSLSSFAGNALLVSPDWLIEDGLLSTTDCVSPQASAAAVDFDAVSCSNTDCYGTHGAVSAPPRARH